MSYIKRAFRGFQTNVNGLSGPRLCIVGIDTTIFKIAGIGTVTQGKRERGRERERERERRGERKEEIKKERERERER